MVAFLHLNLMSITKDLWESTTKILVNSDSVQDKVMSVVFVIAITPPAAGYLYDTFTCIKITSNHVLSREFRVLLFMSDLDGHIIQIVKSIYVYIYFFGSVRNPTACYGAFVCKT